ncbi:MAG TPA: hypothetical protein VIQ54_13880 [Polyangia bacterium]|jgi:biopolymer transport protein ExbD
MAQHYDGEDPKEPGPWGWALGTSVMAAVGAGMGVVGFLGPPWPPVLAMIIVAAGAVGAGWLEAIPREYGLRAWLLSALSWSALGVVLAGATIWYAEGRTELVTKYELLIPLLIALAPFAVIRLIVWAATRKQRRLTIADNPSWQVGAVDVVLAAAVLAMPIAGWAVSRPRVAAAQALSEKVRTHHVLTFVVAAQGTTHDGQPVDRATVDDLCRRAAAADPATVVRVEVSKDSDHDAAVGALTAAQTAGLPFELIRP